MVLDDLLQEIGGADDRSPADIWTSAVHESGHAVAISSLRPCTMRGVSIVQRQDSGGLTDTERTMSIYLRPEDVRDELMIRLAGRAAEEEILGVASAGAGGQAASDLAQATYLAVKADVALGLGGGSLIWRGTPEVHRLAETLAGDPALADRVRIRLDDAYADAREFLRPQLAAVRALATTLVARRVLDGREAEDLIRQHVPGSAKP